MPNRSCPLHASIYLFLALSAYSIVGLVMGLACILAGLLLGLYGVTGHTSWTASVLGVSTNPSDAAPGVVVFVVGIFIVFLTRFKVRETVVSPVQAAIERDLKRMGGGDTDRISRSISYGPEFHHVVRKLRPSLLRSPKILNSEPPWRAE